MHKYAADMIIKLVIEERKEQEQSDTRFEGIEKFSALHKKHLKQVNKIPFFGFILHFIFFKPHCLIEIFRFILDVEIQGFFNRPKNTKTVWFCSQCVSEEHLFLVSVGTIHVLSPTEVEV